MNVRRRDKKIYEIFTELLNSSAGISIILLVLVL